MDQDVKRNVMSSETLWGVGKEDEAYQTIESSICLCVEITALLFCVVDRNIDQLGILRLARRGQDQRRVSCSILNKVRKIRELIEHRQMVLGARSVLTWGL